MRQLAGKLLTIVVLVTFSVTAASQTISALWRSVDATMKNDHPRTRIQLLRQIVQKSEAQRSFGDLLKAEMMITGAFSEISADSVAPRVRYLAAKADRYRSGNVVLAALYSTVVANTLRFYPSALSNDADADEDITKPLTWYKRALENPSALAQSVALDYQPLIEGGRDDRTFLGDLFHVIALQGGEYKTMCDYYKSKGNRNAACISELLLLRHENKEYADLYRAQKSKYLNSVDSLIKVYEDLPEAGELAVEHFSCISDADDVQPEERINYINYALSKWGSWPRMNILRNAKIRLTMPSFQVMINDVNILPGKPNKVIVTSVLNIKELTMNVYRIDEHKAGVDSHGFSKKIESMMNRHLPSVADKQLKSIIDPKVVCRQTRRYIGLPAYRQVRDTMMIEPLKPGFYVVEFSTDNNLIEPESCIINVSDAMLLTLPQPDGLRMAVVSATTGEPLPNAGIAFKEDYSGDDDSKTTVTTVNCDSKGEYVDTRRKVRNMVMKPFAGNDKYAVWQSANGSFFYGDNQRTIYKCDIYTDRSIYRPGQTVHVALLAHSSVKHIVTRVEKSKKINVTLRTVNGKEIAKKEVVTDEMGMASVDMVLPSGILPGKCWISANGDNNMRGYSYIDVEQYKRPTFTIAFDDIKTKYSNGDTLSVRGKAASFAGVPLQNGRVVYTITRRPAYFWRYDFRRDRNTVMSSDTVHTDNKGRFSIPMELLMPEAVNENVPRYYVFSVETRVTNAAGETHTATKDVPLSNRSAFLDISMGERIERSDSMKVKFNYTNVAGTAVDTLVNYTIASAKGGNTVAQSVEKSNRMFALSLSDVASGEYVMSAKVGADTISRHFVVFSIKDNRPAVKTRDWCYCSSEIIPQDGTPVTVQVGSSEKQHILYSVFSDNRILEQGVADVNDSIFTRRFSYDSKKGDAVLLCYAWVKDGVVYKHNVTLTRQLPDNNLTMKWKTFRDRLTPGQKEQWTLSVTDPSGKPAKAQLLAVLYDKSLDDIQKHEWQLTPVRYINTPNTSWIHPYNDSRALYGEMRYNALPERELDFSHFSEELMLPMGIHTENYIVLNRPLMAKVAMADNVREESSDVKVRGVAVSSSKPIMIGSADVSNIEKGENAAVRENLSETAFFYPQLMTDNHGDVNIKFTLPESVTTWRFMALAHDSVMRYGNIDAAAVASKTVMIQPDVPRFLRAGDKATISAMVSNTSEKEVSGTAEMLIADPETGKTLMTDKVKFILAAGESSAVTFSADASQLPSLSTVTFTAKGKNFSDGEQHYLPVLPDKEMVTTTIPLDLPSAGTKVIDIAKLFKDNGESKRLTVEYTDNPEWLVLQALPLMSTPDGDNAVSVASAYYANVIGRFILTSQPGVKSVLERWQTDERNSSQLLSPLEKNSELKSVVLDESPWLRSAEKETEQKRMLINFFDESSMDYRLNEQLTKLKSLQTSEGGFTWWKGMPASPYVTISVIEMLTRLKMMAGAQPQISDVLNKAFVYMDKVVAKNVKEMKETARKSGKKYVRPSNMLVQYLYSCAVGGRQLSTASAADHRYVIECMKQSGTEMTIYGKAAAAVIYARHAVVGADDKRLAAEYVKSIKEHTVYNEQKGRYFDSWKAQYSWCDYRIPSQVAAIEAIRNVTPSDTVTINEMRQWLLQEKRTTAWSTPINSVNAVYAFTEGGSRKVRAGFSGKTVEMSVDNKQLSLPEATSSTGYVKTVVSDSKMNTLEIKKYSPGMSWGAVYGQQMQKNTEIDNYASGFTVTREILKDGKTATHFNVGDRITVKITICAEHDFDFVTVTDKRAACMEPVTQLSGYANGCYRVSKDNAACFFFDKMRKGTKVITADYFIDREGAYDTGVCEVQCAYSPEYAGRTKAKKILVEKINNR